MGQHKLLHESSLVDVQGVPGRTDQWRFPFPSWSPFEVNPSMEASTPKEFLKEDQLVTRTEIIR